MLAAALLAAVSAMAAPAAAQQRDLCSDRPGLGTGACTVEPGRVQVEVGLAGWTLDREDGARSDTIVFADTLARIGVADTVEVQIGWTPLGLNRERSPAGQVERTTRPGDLMLAAKLNLASPDGSGLSAAVLPSVTLPVGRSPIGAGDWSAGLLAPLSYDLNDTIQLQAMPQVDAAVDADGNGRHLAYGATVGLGIGLSDAVTLELEGQVLRDRDPAGHASPALGGVSLAWQPAKNLQLDAGANLALNHAADALELYAGVVRRF